MINPTLSIDPGKSFIMGVFQNNVAKNMILSDRFKQAFDCAFELHKDHLRKGTSIPYLTHLMATATTVLENGGSENEAIAALLHDAVEDQGGYKTLDMIRDRFGEEVANIVDACSDSHSLIKPPWKDRKVKHIEKLRNATHSVFLVSIADKIHNASSIVRDYQQIGEPVWSRFKGGKDGQLWYHGELLRLFQQRGHHPLTDQYRLVVKELFNITGHQEDWDAWDSIPFSPP